MESSRPSLIEYIGSVQQAVEIGIGDRADFAVSLVESGIAVTATDINPVAVPPVIRFIQDDVTAPCHSIYAEAELLYARRLPPELHQPVVQLAQQVDAHAAFTTLGFEWPELPVTARTLGSERWFVVDRSDPIPT